MPELRRDPIAGRWVIIAPERAERPNAHLRAQHEPDQGTCAFCPGNEAMTPDEVRRIGPGARNEPGWISRVVPNRFPALRVETQPLRAAQGLFDVMAGVGAHEVLIETPEHAQPLADQPLAQVVGLFAAAKERMLDLSRDLRLRSIVLFKNHGVAAGATLSHSHSQLIALPLVTPDLAEELRCAKEHFERKERCVFCDVLAQELEDRSRLVYQNEGFVALSPYAARSPFETWILPQKHRSNFETSDSRELEGLGEALKTVLRKLDVALEKPAYNFYLHTQPLREPLSGYYHWHLEVKPMLTQQAGFEWGSGVSINPTPPEEAAAFLRQTEV